MRERGRGAFGLITFILLIILIVVFHAEIFILGVRLYSSFEPNPKADQILAEYYQNRATLYEGYASHYSRQSLNNYVTKLESAPASEKAKINWKIGRLYECSKETNRDLNKAKFYYQEAKKAGGSDTKINQRIDESLTRIDEEIKSNTTPQCADDSEFDYLDKFNIQKLFDPKSKDSSTGYSRDEKKHEAKESQEKESREKESQEKKSRE